MPVSYRKLFELMEKKGIKKIDLRNKHGLNPKTVNSLVNNKSVTVDTIMQLCEIFDCQPGDLMEYIPNPRNMYWVMGGKKAPMTLTPAPNITESDKEELFKALETPGSNVNPDDYFELKEE